GYPQSTSSFSLLAHEALIDASWEKYIKPLLRYKFPGATEEELKNAHAFAYGGAIMPDIGYYPLGSLEFSNLVHYMRSGDFVNALLEESQNIQEYAFALGVLCHYEADTFGHSLGINKAVPILFSRLRKKNGKEVTYEQGRDQHKRVELGFDVLQTAKGNYRSNAYHDFIAFRVNEPVLERAFFKNVRHSSRGYF
ncbi:MAG TPA: zinc dependent phospholipase C family protein, partial [Cyclobacteriaceae bacterium]|nr:zinc dependent phospholipase C family protein [Cyclobacteriaceae bacterium]